MIFRYGIVGVLLFLGMLSFKGTVCAQESYGKIKCICIDAGHGGKDPGCVGKWFIPVTRMCSLSWANAGRLPISIRPTCLCRCT